MGLNHDRYDECIGGWWNLGYDCTQRRQATAYAYGYVNQRAFDEDAPVYARWRTIMARELSSAARGAGSLQGSAVRCSCASRIRTRSIPIRAALPWAWPAASAPRR